MQKNGSLKHVQCAKAYLSLAEHVQTVTETPTVLSESLCLALNIWILYHCVLLASYVYFKSVTNTIFFLPSAMKTCFYVRSHVVGSRTE